MSRRPAAHRYEIDLHGLTVERAIRRLEQELTVCRARRTTPVLVITGRGFGSAGQQSVLGPAIEKWLRGARGGALGVVQCRRVQRGGALWVELSRAGD